MDNPPLQPAVPVAVVPVIPSTGGVATVKPVIPPSPLGGAKPVAGVVPVPVKPVLPGTSPGAVVPVKPVLPGAVVVPVTPGSPLKPVAAVPAPPRETNPKSGTSIVKTAPPKETARITVKPNLPGSGGVRTATAIPTVKPAGITSVPGKATAPETKPVTAPAVVAGKTAVVTPKIAAGSTPVAPARVGTPMTAVPVPYEEPVGSTMLTTVLAGVLAFLTWGTAAVLIASYLSYI